MPGAVTSESINRQASLEIPDSAVTREHLSHLLYCVDFQHLDENEEHSASFQEQADNLITLIMDQNQNCITPFGSDLGKDPKAQRILSETTTVIERLRSAEHPDATKIADGLQFIVATLNPNQTVNQSVTADALRLILENGADKIYQWIDEDDVPAREYSLDADDHRTQILDVDAHEADLDDEHHARSLDFAPSRRDNREEILIGLLTRRESILSEVSEVPSMISEEPDAAPTLVESRRLLMDLANGATVLFERGHFSGEGDRVPVYESMIIDALELVSDLREMQDNPPGDLVFGKIRDWAWKHFRESLESSVETVRA